MREKIQKIVLGNGVTLLYIPGDKTPILFIHGMWEGAWIFIQWMLYASARGHAVYAINLRGHDKDVEWFGDIGSVSIWDYVEDVQTAIRYIEDQTQQVQVVNAVGHSMGGLLTQIVASKGLVRSSVFVTSAPSKEVWLRGWKMIWTLLTSWTYIKNVLFGQPIVMTFEDAWQLELNDFFEEEARAIHRRFTSESGTMTREILFRHVSVKKVAGRSLVIAGLQDQMTIESVQRDIALHLHSEFSSYETGHMPMLGRMRLEISDRILEFINQQ